MPEHDFPFDPTYGYDLAGLDAIAPPPEPPEFAATWRAWHVAALGVEPAPCVRASAARHAGFRVLDLSYRSTDDFPVRGWLLLPEAEPPRLGLILGHGYGGIEAPDWPLPRADAAYLIPCFRGLCRSARAPISTEPHWHVLHDLDKPERYILRGCVEDVWTGTTALLALCPWLAGRIGYLGVSFGGGIGALALPWEPRIARAHLNVPTFGHHPLRQRLPCLGSAAAVQRFVAEHPAAAETLRRYDAAIAAGYIRQPMHLALALFDPVVPPPGQFAIYNALTGPKLRLVLPAGHFPYPAQAKQEAALRTALAAFFEPLAA